MEERDTFRIVADGSSFSMAAASIERDRRLPAAGSPISSVESSRPGGVGPAMPPWSFPLGTVRPSPSHDDPVHRRLVPLEEREGVLEVGEHLPRFSASARTVSASVVSVQGDQVCRQLWIDGLCRGDLRRFLAYRQDVLEPSKGAGKTARPAARSSSGDGGVERLDEEPRPRAFVFAQA